MPFRVSGQNLDIGDALRERISQRVVEALSKHFNHGYSGHVTVSRDGFGYRTESAIHLPTGITLEAQGWAADAYASADQAALRIEKRLRRYQRRLKDRSSARAAAAAPEMPLPEQASTYVITAPAEEDEAEVDAFVPVVVAEATTELRRLPVSEAVMELDLTGAPVVVFRHATHGRVNVVYRRADGHIGWIDPAEARESTA